MATAEPTHIGTRIRYWRRRRNGMSQAAIAGLSGLSQSFISMVENGDRTVERRSDLVALAEALRVSVSELLGQPSGILTTDTPGIVVAIEAALVEVEDGERRSPTRGADEMAAAITHLSELRSRAEHASIARLLPELLVDAAAYGGVYLTLVGDETANALSCLGYRSLGRSAAKLALAGALDVGDPAWVGAAQFRCLQTMPIESARARSRVTERALNDLQAKAADPNVRQILGLLHLSAALACAVDKRPDDAEAHLREAEREAQTLGDPEDGVGFNLHCFGPTNVGLWRMAITAELGEHGKVVELAVRVDPGPLRTAGRHFNYWLDYGRALAHSGKADTEARAAFFRAEQAAPVLFSNNPMAHDTVLTMVNRVRGAVPKDLQVLAHRVGIDVARVR